jgi:hypothetical protein
MSSFEVVDALLEHMPGAAVHVLVAATHRTAYNYDSAPCSPTTCIAKAEFVFTFITNHTLQLSMVTMLAHTEPQFQILNIR